MQYLILLIDDDPEELEIMNEALQKGNIEALCMWAGGLQHATRTLQEIAPDFIFIDMNMPVANGITCLQGLKKNKDLATTPMVMYSTSISDDTRTKAMASGASWCIQKPDNIDALAYQLLRFLTVTSHHDSYSNA